MPCCLKLTIKTFALDKCQAALHIKNMKKPKKQLLRRAAKQALEWLEQYMDEAEGDRSMENIVAGDQSEGVIGVAEIVDNLKEGLATK